MYAMNFDDFKRKLESKTADQFPFRLELLETCIKNTPIWDGWFGKFLAEDSDIHISIEDDCSTYTFYRVVPR
jgi:hypothetical protein